MSRLEELERAEADAKKAWRSAVQDLYDMREKVNQSAEAHTQAQQEVIAELQRQVSEGGSR